MSSALSDSFSCRGEAPRGFDFTVHMRRLCADMIARLVQLQHIDITRIAVSFSQTRKPSSYGIYAAVTPLRFVDGALSTVRRGRRWGMRRLFDRDGREMLYILTFYLPRFLDLPFSEKLTTVVHELWHVSPKFDGDVRRLGGRCFAHGASQKQYDAHVGALVDRWLSFKPPESLYGFLRFNFRELAARHGRVIGQRVPPPKLVRLD